MLRRQFLQSMGAAGAAVAQSKRPPNFVFLLTDDLGYGDLGCYGSKDIRTPHIDRLAREGTRFTDCYANGPVCTPTRTAFLTGRYQQRFGAELEWAIGIANNKRTGLNASETVVSRALKPAGYRSAVIGKWHVGWNPEFRPLRHGFDESYGILMGNADMYTHKYHDGSDDLWENDQPVNEVGYLTELLARKAVSFVDRNAGNPFLLYLPFNAPHWPFQPPGRPGGRTLENWRDGERSEYVGMVEGVDDAVGQVMSALRRNRLDENTMVVFTNDNGGERLSDNGPFFHTKSTLFEGGIRVPAIARWPGMIPAGRTTRQTAMTMDFTATFLAAAGVKPPGGIELDGTDLMPVLSGRMPVQERTLCWRIQQAGRRQLAVRRGRWKYIDDNTGNRTFPELLFDLETDPAEHKNVFYKHQAMAADLRKAGLAWEASVQPK